MPVYTACPVMFDSMKASPVVQVQGLGFASGFCLLLCFRALLLALLLALSLPLSDAQAYQQPPARVRLSSQCR